MALITQMRLTMAAHNCPDTLARLAQKVSSTAFEPALKNYDAVTINKILEEEVRHLLGTESLSHGLEQYCRKFGIGEDLTQMDNIDRILLIDQYREEIERQLRDAGV